MLSLKTDNERYNLTALSLLLFIGLVLTAASLRIVTYSTKVHASSVCHDGTRVPTTPEEDCGSYCFDQNKQRMESCPSAQGGKFGYIRYSDSGPKPNSCYVRVPEENGTRYTKSDCPELFNPPATSDTADTTTTTQPAIERQADKAFGGCEKIETGTTTSTGCGFVEKYVNPGINLLAGAVGMIVTIMLIVAGIQYSTAGGDPNKVAAAKGKIANAILALVAFFFTYAVLQWLVPGGVF